MRGWVCLALFPPWPHPRMVSGLPRPIRLSYLVPQDRVGHCHCTHGSKQGFWEMSPIWVLCLNRPIASCCASPLRHGGAGGVCQSYRGLPVKGRFFRDGAFNPGRDETVGQTMQKGRELYSRRVCQPSWKYRGLLGKKPRTSQG
ncbi:hypothetical protein F4818DRAFT_418607 [Hypoxylon cercidicola]|nr:hypothetical protein F4818DRAFT_418607 [Hypoxylon cercidicola]